MGVAHDRCMYRSEVGTYRDRGKRGAGQRGVGAKIRDAFSYQLGKEGRASQREPRLHYTPFHHPPTPFVRPVEVRRPLIILPFLLMCFGVGAAETFLIWTVIRCKVSERVEGGREASRTCSDDLRRGEICKRTKRRGKT